MVDYLELLRKDLEKGYSKADLEKLIGLPKNSLSGVIKGDKKLSKKSMVKIDIWEASDKPGLFELNFGKKLSKKIEKQWADDNKALAEPLSTKNNPTITRGIIHTITTEPKEGSMAWYLKYGNQ